MQRLDAADILRSPLPATSKLVCHSLYVYPGLI